MNKLEIPVKSGIVRATHRNRTYGPCIIAHMVGSKDCWIRTANGTALVPRNSLLKINSLGEAEG